MGGASGQGYNAPKHADSILDRERQRQPAFAALRKSGLFVGGPNITVWGDSRWEGAAYITQALNPSVSDKWRDTLRKDAKGANAPHKEGSENAGETPSLYTETVGTTTSIADSDSSCTEYVSSANGTPNT